MRASSTPRSPTSATLMPNRSLSASTTAAASSSRIFSLPPARWMVRLRPARLHRASSVTLATVRLVTKCDDGWVETYQLPTFRSIFGARPRGEFVQRLPLVTDLGLQHQPVAAVLEAVRLVRRLLDTAGFQAEWRRGRLAAEARRRRDTAPRNRGTSRPARCASAPATGASGGSIQTTRPANRRTRNPISAST